MYKEPKSLGELMAAFGLSLVDLDRIAKQSGQIRDTCNRLKFDSERHYRAFRNTLLSAYQNRAKNEETLAARLAEIDTTESARHARAARYVARLRELPGTGGAAHFRVFAHLYRAAGIPFTFCGKPLNLQVDIRGESSYAEQRLAYLEERAKVRLSWPEVIYVGGSGL